LWSNVSNWVGPAARAVATWTPVHEALPAGWTVGPPTYDPGISAWSVTGRSKVPGRGKPPVTVTGTGPDETAALRDLDDRLRGVPQPDGSRMEERERRYRQAYVTGAEEWSRERLGRGLSQDELERVIRRLP
jgi:hypothetical protein